MPEAAAQRLHDIFAATAARFPQHVALEIPPGSARAERCSWTYARLLERSTEFRDALRDSLRPDAVASILLPRESPDLYAAQLGVLMAGGAFSCLDPRFPEEHLRSVLEEADAEVLITDDAGAKRLETLDVAPRRLLPTTAVAPLDPVAAAAAAAVDGAASGPRNLAYVIYTSGTTGRPKGVMIEHRSIVNLVLYDVAEFGLGPDDRVAQCSSPAYDSSIDETWLAFTVGATLVVLDDETVRLGPDLVPWLRRERITAFCPPPTLLRATGCADPETELPELRFLYVGGEALSQDLADRWARGRRMDNGYGPTECSVVITRSRVLPGEPVTIGQPVPGNVAHLLDERLRPVAEGEPGELCLSGVGLARGYRGRRGLTAERFPVHPRFGRIYRTGDLVRRNEAGDLEYLGRLDGQVKLRGYRVELGAVEAHLAACAGVRAAACRVQGEGAAQILCAHVVAQDRSPAAHRPTIEELRAELRGRLPEYMVPARIAWIEALPTSVSGKLDRRALPEIAAAATNGAPEGPGAAEAAGAEDGAKDAIEQAVAAAFARAIGHGVAPPAAADFFLDLGGDSLGAVAVVVALREAGHEEAAVRDVYEARTVEGIAERLRGRLAGPQARPWVGSSASEPGGPRRSPWMSTACQGLWLALEVWLFSTLAYFALFRGLPWLARELGPVVLLALAPLLSFAALAGWLGFAVAATAAAKAILIGRYRAGRVPVWSAHFTRHWIVAHTARLIPWGWLEGTTLYGTVLRALGAKVGRRVHIHRGVDLHHGGWDLLELGDDVTLCQEAAPRLVEFDDGHLVMGAVRLGAGVTVETRAGLSPGSAMGANSFLSALSWLPPGSRVPAGQLWDGVPAAFAGPAPAAPALAADPALSPGGHGALEIAGRLASRWLAWMPLVALGLWFLGRIPAWRDPQAALKILFADSPAAWRSLGVLLLLTLVSAPVSLFAQGLVLRLQGRVPVGTFSIWSRQALVVWYKSGVVDAAGRWLSGSLFWPWWLRLAGMRIGKRCEVSTIIDVVPETVSIDDESFFADGIYFCQPRYHRGAVSVAETRLGRRTFLGNHAVVPAGVSWPDELFLGVATVADPEQVRPDSAWFGHPPMALPRREVIAADRRLTYEPDALRFITRLCWETARFLLPVLPAGVLLAWALTVHDAASRLHAPAFFGFLLPLASLAAIAAPALAVVAAKWLLLGRVRPGQHAFWSCWCGRWDLLYMAWSQWARGSLTALEGTLFLNAFLRLTGMRIGRGVVLGSGFTQVVDPDMLEFEDHATVSCQFQAHTFEDRILKIDRLVIRRGATVGANTVVFYGADIGPGARVAPHGVVMKRDVLPGHRAYAGNPARELAENGAGGAAGAWAARSLDAAIPTPAAAEAPLQAT